VFTRPPPRYEGAVPGKENYSVASVKRNRNRMSPQSAAGAHVKQLKNGGREGCDFPVYGARTSVPDGNATLKKEGRGRDKAR